MNSFGIVNILDSSKKSIGTGFFVSPKGYILTCKHVLNKANYRKKECVRFKDAFDSSTYEAQWIKSSDSEDLAILQTNKKVNNYLPLCDRDSRGLTIESYGFPNGSKIELKASAIVDRVYDEEKHFQLGKANSITTGFSGAPLIYDEVAIGIIYSITKTDLNGRLSEVAFAISAKNILKLFPGYIEKKEVCLGYGDKFHKCSNYAISKNEGLCKECFTVQFYDAVKSLYIAQNYHIHFCDGFFVTELKYGIGTYYDAVFTIVKFNELIKEDDLFRVIALSEKSKFSISQTVIVTNTKLCSECSRMAKDNKIVVKTKEELLRSLFDFNSYRVDLSKHVNSKQLSSHYIEVYCADSSWDEEEIRNEEDYGDEELDYYYFDSEDDENEFKFNYSKKIDERIYNENDKTVNNEWGDTVPNEKPNILLKKYVNDFLKSKHKALLILGDYGSGKTSFCYNYALELINRFIKKKSSFLPLLIKLRGYNKAVGIAQLLTDYFVNDLGINNFNISSLKLLLKNLNVVLIFDGYDEVAKKVDFDIKYDVLKEICGLVEGGTKIIVTCRPNYFQDEREFKQIFQNSHLPYEPGEKPILNFIENSIADLTQDQIDTYIASYKEELEKSQVSISEILKTIANTHDLTDLAKRPFLLYMILNTLPKILREEKAKKNTKINAAKLYLVYTDTWIKREESKNKTLIKKSDKELFCKELAFELYTSNTVSLSYKDFPATIKKHFRYVERIEDIDYFTHDIQSCSFLTSDRTGEFRFIHKSFMEYFIADRVICKLSDSLRKTKNEDKLVKKIDSILGSTYLSMEICLFINDILQLQKKDVIKETSGFFEDVNVIAKSNLLSIFAKTEVNIVDFLLRYEASDDELSHVDFSGGKFRHGILKNLSFKNVQFYSSIFDNVIFINCNFNGGSFNKSRLNNIKFYGCQFSGSKWNETTVEECSFGSEYEKYYYIDEKENEETELRKNYTYIDFKNSIWKESTIVKSSFSNCIFETSTMLSMKIQKTEFEHVDFSGTKVSGSLLFRNNALRDVIGEPYEF